jgi:GTP-binding protein HflX
VGFVRNLPHQLVEAFRSTLEEVADSDVIIHVVDASHPDPASQIATVRDVIGDVGGRDIAEIIVFNKSDLVSDDDRLVLRGLAPDGIFASARTGEGIQEILDRIADKLPRPSVIIEALVPYDRGELISMLHRRAQVTEIDYTEEGTRVEALVGEEVAAQLGEFVLTRRANPSSEG